MASPRQRRRSNSAKESSGDGGIADYRSELWKMADALRGSMDAAEYKHVVLGLIFLKYISDAFEEAYAQLEKEIVDGADPEDPDEYRAQSIFWVPPEARWPRLQSQARQPTIGRAVDDAMSAIERDNPALKDVLPKDYARPALDKTRLGQVVDLVSNIRLGGADARATDVLGSVYEYFLEQFALAEGRKGGEFYTPRSVVRLLVEMLEPFQGRVYDPCCGSSGMFVQSVEFIRAHTSGNGNGGRARGDIAIYGQESNYTTWRMARMNLAIRGIEGRIEHGDSFHNDRHPDLRADYILANPPFNVSDWGGERLRDDRRWEYGVPPVGNANFAWVQHFPLPPCAARHGGLRPGQRLHVVEPVRRGRDTKEPDRGRPGGLHRRPARPALPLHADTRLPVVPLQGTPQPSGRDPLHRRPQAGPHDRPHAPRPLPGGHRPRRRTPTTPGAEGRTPASTPTFPASARARRWRRFASTATSSRPAATSAPSHSPTTACPSRTRWPTSPLNGENSRPRRTAWTGLSRRISRGWGSVKTGRKQDDLSH